MIRTGEPMSLKLRLLVVAAAALGQSLLVVFYRTPQAGPAGLLVLLLCLSLLAAWLSFGLVLGAVSLVVALWHLGHFAGRSPTSIWPWPALLLVPVGYAVWYRHRRRRLATEARLKLQALWEEGNSLEEELRRLGSYHKALQGRLNRFPLLRQTAERLGRCLNVEELAQLLADQCLGIMEEVDTALIYLVDEDSGHLMLKTYAARSLAFRPDSIAGDEDDRHVLATSKPLLTGPSGASARMAARGAGAGVSYMITPMRLREKSEGGEYSLQVVGVLRVNARPGVAFDREDMALLNIIGDLGVMALANARLYQKTEQLAIRDSLTGLFSPHEFRLRLQEELGRADRLGYEVSLLMLDIDHFKQYNDTYGHPAGDVVLQKIGERLARFCSPRDLAGRYGGEEFAVLFTAEREQAIETAERLRQEVAQMVFPLGEQRTSVTISLGLASYPRDSREREALLGLADQALYRAKAQGRNRLNLAEPDQTMNDSAPEPAT